MCNRQTDRQTDVQFNKFVLLYKVAYCNSILKNNCPPKYSFYCSQEYLKRKYLDQAEKDLFLGGIDKESGNKGIDRRPWLSPCGRRGGRIADNIGDDKTKGNRQKTEYSSSASDSPSSANCPAIRPTSLTVNKPGQRLKKGDKNDDNDAKDACFLITIIKKGPLSRYEK